MNHKSGIRKETDMTTICVDADAMLALVRACKEFELDGRACRSAMNSIRLNPSVDQRFAQVYGEYYQAERTGFGLTLDQKYAPIFDAIEHGTDVSGALKHLADRMRR